MKAKDYAAKFDELMETHQDNAVALAYILNDFTREFSDLAVQRGQQSESACLACFREMEQKYHAFCRLVTKETVTFKPDGWRRYLEAIHPALWETIRVMMLRTK